jgi:hypothetical protein
VLSEGRGVPNAGSLHDLSVEQILAQAAAHHRTGAWSTVNSGPVAETPAERWDLIDNALRQGHRGLGNRAGLPWPGCWQ